MIRAALLVLLLATSGAAATLPPLPACAPTSGNRVEPVFGTAEFARRLAADIRAAQTSVHLDIYMFGGEMGVPVAQALVERHHAGVDVRVILDTHRGTLPRLKEETQRVLSIMQNGAVPVRWSVSRPPGLVVHHWTEDHDKLCILDGRTAWCGGANIADTFARFNDLMMRVEGPTAAQLDGQFAFDWEVAGLGKPPTVPDQTYPVQGLLEHDGDAATSTVRVVGTGIGRVTFDGALVNAIRSAKTIIQVQQHQFGYDTAIDELIAAHQRGVDVRVLVDPSNIDNMVPVFHHGPHALFNARAVLRLQAAGVNVRAVKLESTFDAYHMKLGVFDRKLLLVGSGNWERASAKTSTETDLEVAGGPATEAVVAWQDHMWNEQSEPASATRLAAFLQYLYDLYF